MADPFERFAKLALDCVHREYPNKIAHTMQSDADTLPPRRLTPAFFGCYDWHSAVHGHWLLARLSRMYPDAPYAAAARAALARSITPANIAGEQKYLEAEGRSAFERPYGLAWLLQLGVELRKSSPGLAEALGPLEKTVVQRFEEWLPKLRYPVRSGEHSNTAFALAFARDWARETQDRGFEELINRRIRDFYLADRECLAKWEPSGEDFLSPSLAEADLMRRILPSEEFAEWFWDFLPDWGCLEPMISPDPGDPKLAHLDGLNLSRAWMLEGILRALPADDTRRPALIPIAKAHRDAGLAAVTGERYEGGHWLGTFAVYLMTA